MTLTTMNKLLVVAKRDVLGFLNTFMARLSLNFNMFFRDYHDIFDIHKHTYHKNFVLALQLFHVPQTSINPLNIWHIAVSSYIVGSMIGVMKLINIFSIWWFLLVMHIRLYVVQCSVIYG